MKPNYKRPTLWAVYVPSVSDYRLRIVYPHGEAEWIAEWCKEIWHTHPCWNGYGSKSAQEAVRKMKRYDRACRAETLFLGNL